MNVFTSYDTTKVSEKPDETWPADTLQRIVFALLIVCCCFSLLWIETPFLAALVLSLGGVLCLHFLSLLLGTTQSSQIPAELQQVDLNGSNDPKEDRLRVSPSIIAEASQHKGDASSNKNLVDTIPVPALLIDDSGAVISANDQAIDILSTQTTHGGVFSGFLQTNGLPVMALVENELNKNDGVTTAEILLKQYGGPMTTILRLVRLPQFQAQPILVTFDSISVDAPSAAEAAQNQKMQAIGQLAGGIAHDFNNLLTAISGHCDLLLLRHNRTDQEYPDLMQINQNANRAAALVRQLLAFSRKQKMETALTNVRTTLSDLSHLLGRLVGTHIDLDVKHDMSDPCIHMDKRQLEQILMNLVVNARDAMPNGGSITITVTLETFLDPWEKAGTEIVPGQYVCISVTDTGAGIDPQILDKIFDPFFTTKQLGEGTGLGLSTVFGIMKQTGGHIFADSELGHGTSFTLYFEASEAVQPIEPVAKVTNQMRTRSAGAVVLLVEDEAPVRAFASKALQLDGHTVIEVASGDEALDLLAGADHPPIELILSDVIMPGRDGPTWVREARKILPHVPTIFASGYSDGKFDKSIKGLGPVSFLQKPFSLRALSDEVNQVLALASERDPTKQIQLGEPI